MSKDYYKILEVSSTDDDDKIKENFRRLAKKYHPDISKEKNAEVIFREITEAYEVLSDATARKKYDESQMMSSLNNVTDNMFNSFDKKFAVKKYPKKPKKGPLLLGRVVLKTKDVINTGKAIITLTVEENCPACKGKGYYLDHGFEYLCTNCQGIGRFDLQKTITVYIPNFSKTKQKVLIPRVGHAGYAGGERGDVKLKLILQ